MRVGLLRGFYKPQVTGHKPLPKTPTPALPEGEGDLPRNKLLATSYPLISVTTYHAPRTAYPRADTWVRPYDEITHITNHEPRLQATSYRPHAAFPDSPDEAGSSGRDPGPMPREKPIFCCL